MSDINKTLEERGQNYGEFIDNARISQKLKAVMLDSNPDKYEPYMIEAIEMICHKLARIANGSPEHIDSWYDIAGYATLVVCELEKKEKDIP